MVELKLQRPYVDAQERVREGLEKHYAEDKYVEGYVYNNEVYYEPQYLTPMTIDKDIKIVDINTKKVFRFEGNELVEDKINKYYIIQVETGIEYAEAVDLYPCKYTYRATDKPLISDEEK